MDLTKQQARQFILAYQGLLPPRELKGKAGILQHIKRVGCIQYDPLDRVGYNSHLVLQSRIDQYTKKELTELLYEDRQLVDGWDKNMSVYPVEDWPYFKRYKDEAYERYGGEFDPVYKALPEIREILSTKGPLSSIDIKLDAKVDWAWAPTRLARAVLESMFFWGELTIHHKVGTRKVYDFSSKLLPQQLLEESDPNNTIEEYIEWHVKRRIDAIGLLWNRLSDAWLGIHYMKTKERSRAILNLIQKGELSVVHIENIDHPFYLSKEYVDLAYKIIKGITIEPQVTFIAPLDNLLWDRKLIKELFGFDYKWEVYTPIKERKYGYYVLPVLYGDQFIARFEPKHDKKTGTLEIINWWWEPDVGLTEPMKMAIYDCIEHFKSYLNAKTIKYDGRNRTLRDIFKGFNDKK